MLAIPLIIFFVVLAGFFVIGFFTNFYKTLYWSVGNLLGYAVGTLIGYFLCTTIAKMIVAKIPLDVPLDFVPILEPVLFLVVILIILTVWNLIILIPLHFILRRLIKKGMESVKTQKNKTKKLLFKFGSAGLMTVTFLPFTALTSTSVSTGIEVSEPWGGVEEYNPMTMHVKDLTFTTFNLSAKDYYEYVKASNAVINLIKTNGMDGLTEIFGSFENILAIPDGSDGEENYLQNLFDTADPIDNYYPTVLENILQQNDIGEQLQSIFSSIVYEKSFETVFSTLLSSLTFGKDQIDQFIENYEDLTTDDGKQDAPPNDQNYFRLPSYTLDNINSNYYIIVSSSMFEKTWNSVYEIVQGTEGVDAGTAETFSTDLIHMFMWANPSPTLV